MKVFGKICLIAVVVAFAGASFAQTVLVNQAPNGVNGFFSDSDLENFGGVPQSSATGFQIGADAMLTRTIIWGLYLPGSAAAPPSFTVSVRDGASLEIVNGGTAIDTRNAGLTVTGVDLFGGLPELRVSISNPTFSTRCAARGRSFAASAWCTASGTNPFNSYHSLARRCRFVRPDAPTAARRRCRSRSANMW